MKRSAESTESLMGSPEAMAALGAAGLSQDIIKPNEIFEPIPGYSKSSRSDPSETPADSYVVD